jgi:hypothetical protein
LLRLQGAVLANEEAKSISHLQLQRRYQGHPWSEVQRIVCCESCGAQLTMTQHLAKSCAFCGSTSVIVGDSQQSFEQPDGFLPFTIDEREAAGAIYQAQRRQEGRGDNMLEITGPQGVYLPFWLFDGTVELRWWIQDGLAAPLAPLPGTAEYKRFDKILFLAVHLPPPSFLEPVQSFYLTLIVPYEPHLLADCPALLYSLDVEGVAEEAGNALLALARQQAGPSILWQQPILPASLQRKSRTSRPRRTFQVSDLNYQLVLLPVWIAPLRNREKRRLALVNGQTGEATLCP